MDQDEQNSEVVEYYDSRYLDEHLKYKGILQQRGRYSNEAYRFAEYCKYICLGLLAIGLFLLLLSWASYFFRKEKVIETIVTVDRTNQVVRGPQFSPGEEGAIINVFPRGQETEVGSSNSSAPTINRAVDIFERVEIEGIVVITGFEYDPPFHNGLGEPSSSWCYSAHDDDGLEAHVNYYSSGRGGELVYNEAYQGIMSRSQFNRLKPYCQVQ